MTQLLSISYNVTASTFDAAEFQNVTDTCRIDFDWKTHHSTNDNFKNAFERLLVRAGYDHVS